MTEIDFIKQRIRIHQRQLSIVAGAVDCIGQLVHRRHTSADLDNLGDEDMEGLGMALQGLSYASGASLSSIDAAVDDLEKLQEGGRGA